jgi:hypothetical protein
MFPEKTSLELIGWAQKSGSFERSIRVPEQKKPRSFRHHMPSWNLQIKKTPWALYRAEQVGQRKLGAEVL